MTTRIPRFSLDGQVRFPATSLIAIASTCLRGLHSYYTSRLRSFETAKDEDGATEAIECLQDVELVLKDVDPSYWHEVLSQRIEPQEMPKRLVDDKTQMTSLLALGAIPKAFWTIPKAVEFYRKARPSSVAKEEVENEDVLLDMLIFLAEKRERAGLLSVVE